MDSELRPLARAARAFPGAALASAVGSADFACGLAGWPACWAAMGRGAVAIARIVAKTRVRRIDNLQAALPMRTPAELSSCRGVRVQCRCSFLHLHRHEWFGGCGRRKRAVRP